MSHLHLVLAPRSGNRSAREKLTEAHNRLAKLLEQPLVTDSYMACELAAIVGALVDVERYLSDPGMDWRRSG